MDSITGYMTADHRACDEQLAAVEDCAGKSQWPPAAAAWRRFEAATRCHLQREEQVLFPAFENATGQRHGPTMVMRMEHEQMRGLFAAIADAIASQDARRLLSMTDTLMVLMQQHNMKEEQMLYPMCDRAIGDAAATVQKMAALLPDQS